MPEDDADDPLLTTNDAALLARRSPITIRSWAHDGILVAAGTVPGRYPGKPRPLYRRSAVWEAERQARERDDTTRSAQAVHRR